MLAKGEIGLLLLFHFVVRKLVNDVYCGSNYEMWSHGLYRFVCLNHSCFLKVILLRPLFFCCNLICSSTFSSRFFSLLLHTQQAIVVTKIIEIENERMPNECWTIDSVKMKRNTKWSRLALAKPCGRRSRIHTRPPLPSYSTTWPAFSSLYQLEPT